MSATGIGPEPPWGKGKEKHKGSAGPRGLFSPPTRAEICSMLDGLLCLKWYKPYSFRALAEVEPQMEAQPPSVPKDMRRGDQPEFCQGAESPQRHLRRALDSFLRYFQPHLGSVIGGFGVPLANTMIIVVGQYCHKAPETLVRHLLYLLLPNLTPQS